MLPVLKRVEITKEIYDLIQEYIILTNEYGKSDTLLSYRAQDEFRKKVYGNCYNTKINFDVYNRSILGNLLKRFYEKVIKEKYGDKLISEKLLPGDTRHIAFTSLMLQGYYPVEIAVIGGHRTLDALYNYTCSPNIYIDNEVISIVSSNVRVKSKDTFKYMEKVLKMDAECPRSIDECFPTEIGGVELGVCTAGSQVCDKNICESDECCDCSKWWCEPTEYNYNCLEKIIKEKLSNKSSKLQRSIEFMMELLKKSGVNIGSIQSVENAPIYKEIKRTALKIECEAKGIIHLKYNLVNNTENNIQIINQMEDLLPINSVNKIVQKTIEGVIDKGVEGKWADQKEK